MVESAFDRGYEKWQERARDDLLQRVEKGDWPWTERMADRCEIYETGEVHFRGSLITTEPGYVTPWDKSEHFVDWRE